MYLGVKCCENSNLSSELIHSRSRPSNSENPNHSTPDFPNRLSVFLRIHFLFPFLFPFALPFPYATTYPSSSRSLYPSLPHSISIPIKYTPSPSPLFSLFLHPPPPSSSHSSPPPQHRKIQSPFIYRLILRHPRIRALLSQICYYCKRGQGAICSCLLSRCWVLGRGERG